MLRLKLLIAGVTLALIGYGAVEILECLRFSHVQTLTYEQFVQKRPQEGCYNITGGRIDAADTLQSQGSTSHEQRYYVPLLSAKQQESSCYVMVETTDETLLASQPKANADGITSVANVVKHDVEGMLITGVHADSELRRKIAQTGLVANDYVILEEGRHPSLLKGLGILALGILLAVAQVSYYRSSYYDA